MFVVNRGYNRSMRREKMFAIDRYLDFYLSNISTEHKNVLYTEVLFFIGREIGRDFWRIFGDIHLKLWNLKVNRIQIQSVTFYNDSK